MVAMLVAIRRVRVRISFDTSRAESGLVPCRVRKHALFPLNGARAHRVLGQMPEPHHLRRVHQRHVLPGTRMFQ
jgi:hypothetical protein